MTGQTPGLGARVVGKLRRAPRWLGICLVRFYQACISPRFPACCRYVPSCSQYAVEAIERFGLVRGSWLALRRICRCHPFHDGGFDPVPQQFCWFGRSSGNKPS